MKSLITTIILVLPFFSCIRRNDHRTDEYILHKDTATCQCHAASNSKTSNVEKSWYNKEDSINIESFKNTNPLLYKYFKQEISFEEYYLKHQEEIKNFPFPGGKGEWVWVREKVDADTVVNGKYYQKL